MRLLSASLGHLIKRGTLTVVDVSGRRHVFAGSDSPALTIRLHKRGVATRLALNPELYLGESYMDGTISIEDGDIYDLLNLVQMNRGWHHGDQDYNPLTKLRPLWRRVAQRNPVRRACRNAAHHYDLSNELYEAFLDSDLQYSCGYFLHPDDTLEKAQLQKKAHIAAKLCLRPRQQVLDIGCGWGGLAIYLSRNWDVDVTGISLSNKQVAHAVSYANWRDPQGRVDIRFQDYRQIDGQYDRIVSVGMFEHVGVPHYKDFFKAISDHLSDDGVALLHTIGRSEGPDADNAWIAKYIFPGAYVPALSEIVPQIERAGLYMTDIEVLRLHYAMTVRAWRGRFAANRDRMRSLYDERFCRMWEFYLAAVEAAFRHAGQVVFQIQLAKRQDAVPLTRDYMMEQRRQTRHRPDVAA